VSTAPTFAEYQGYVAMDAFVQGLKAAGANPTQASLVNALLGMTAYKPLDPMHEARSTSSAIVERVR
jgi:hypothetical protein